MQSDFGYSTLLRNISTDKVMNCCSCGSCLYELPLYRSMSVAKLEAECRQTVEQNYPTVRTVYFNKGL